MLTMGTINSDNIFKPTIYDSNSKKSIPKEDAAKPNPFNNQFNQWRMENATYRSLEPDTIQPDGSIKPGNGPKQLTIPDGQDPVTGQPFISTQENSNVNKDKFAFGLPGTSNTDV